ncbi:MAG: adaptor protein MecA [Lachnospiraceae bacterium]|nr:adaptor protein MecA [Lachnospiraceae bacterium]
MRIERVNDRQIRCTLTKADLADRQLKISELAYGTEKAKLLFRDMMQQAEYQLGFEAEDIPLMIEAIPLSGEAIVLIITKVEDPEELDTRFSKFAPSVREEMSDGSYYDQEKTAGADDIIDLFKKIKQQAAAAVEAASANAGAAAGGGAPREVQITIQVDLTKMYSFGDLSEAIRVAHILKGIYHGENCLYKSLENGRFYLVMKKSDHTPEQFNKICNMLSEYADTEDYTPAIESFIKEHSEVLIPELALEKLALM